MTKQPYKASADLELFILTHAPEWCLSKSAPDTFPALRDAYSNGGKLPVYDADGEQSIFSTPFIHYAFRAWHDAEHIRLNAEFDRPGEVRLARDHVKQLRAAGIGLQDQLAIWYSIWGQVKFSLTKGEFPPNCNEFIQRCFELGVNGAIRSYN